MAKDWIEKHYVILNIVWKFLIPVSLFLGSLMGNYFISFYGIETKASAAQTYATKESLKDTRDAMKMDSIARAKTDDEYKKMMITLGLRQEVDRRAIVKLNYKNGLQTEDYPIMMGDVRREPMKPFPQ